MGEQKWSFSESYSLKSNWKWQKWRLAKSQTPILSILGEKMRKLKIKIRLRIVFHGKPQLERLPLWIGMRMIERMDSAALPGTSNTEFADTKE